MKYYSIIFISSFIFISCKKGQDCLMKGTWIIDRIEQAQNGTITDGKSTLVFNDTATLMYRDGGGVSTFLYTATKDSIFISPVSDPGYITNRVGYKCSLNKLTLSAPAYNLGYPSIYTTKSYLSRK